MATDPSPPQASPPLTPEQLADRITFSYVVVPGRSTAEALQIKASIQRHIEAIVEADRARRTPPPPALPVDEDALTQARAVELLGADPRQIAAGFGKTPPSTDGARPSPSPGMYNNVPQCTLRVTPPPPALPDVRERVEQIIAGYMSEHWTPMRLENEITAALQAQASEGHAVARPLADWHEDIGPVLWWHFEGGEVHEPPYAGTPLDDEWAEIAAGHHTDDREGYYTHWTPIAVPALPLPGQGET